MSINAIVSKPKNLRREHKIVSQEEWIVARKELLKKEKESTRLRDRLSAERRKLPWVKSEKGKDIIVYGGPAFASSLIRAGLIDEFHLFVNPAALGKGRSRQFHAPRK